MSLTPWFTLKSKCIRLNNQQLIRLSPLNRSLPSNLISLFTKCESPSETTTSNNRHDICPLHTDTDALAETEATVVGDGGELSHRFAVCWVGG